MNDKMLKNLLILLPVLVGIGLAAYFLHSDYHSTVAEEQSINREVIGELVYSENNVKRQYDNDVLWDGIEKKTPIYNRDSIRTGKDSTAGIKLSDSTIIELNENSLIVLDKTQQNLSLKFKAGDISTKNSGKNLLINVNDSVIKGEGADINIKSGNGKKTNIKVAKGKATITDKNQKSAEINQSELADVDEEGLQDVSQIAVILKTPENKTQILTPKGAYRQAFTWEVTNPSLKLEQFEISKNSGFKPEGTQVYKGHQAVSPQLSPGTYYWRVGWLNTNTDKNKSKLLYTEVRSIVVGSDTRLELLFPENETKFDFLLEENVIELRWKCQIPTKAFVTEISRTTDFRKIVFSKTLAESNILVKDLGPGYYFWRVRAFGDRNEELATSPTQSFTVKLKISSLPELIKPVHESIWESTEPIEFLWKKMENATEYRLVLSKDPDQKEVIRTKSVTGVSFLTPVPTQGTYYWSVKALGNHSNVVGNSEVRKISFKLKPKSQAFILVNPKERGTILREATEGGNLEPVLFQWQTIRPLPGPLTLYVSQREDFNEALKQENLTGKLFSSITLAKSGTYYWKLISESPAGQEKKSVETSEVGTFTLKLTNNFEIPILVEPADKSNIEISGPTAVKFMWNPMPQAVQYHIIVERINDKKKGRTQLIDRLVKEWTLMSAPLGEGDYSWTVSSITSDGEEGGQSKPFTFTQGIPAQMDAPKLNAPVVK